MDQKKVVVVNVPKGRSRPYRMNQGKYYIRTTSGCRDASREELLRLVQATESLFYDETPFLGHFEVLLTIPRNLRSDRTRSSLLWPTSRGAERDVTQAKNAR